jgi:peptidoglycan DL-endopeptidase CwlO
VGISRTVAAALFVVVAAALLAGDLSAAPSPKQRLREKQAQQDAVIAELNRLNTRFEASVEAWNGARYELGLAKKRLAVDRARLHVAEHQRAAAVGRLEARVRTLYETSDDQTTLGILLGSTSLSDFLDRMNAAKAISASDRELVAQTTAARARYAAAARQTAAVERRREIALGQRDRERRSIGAMLAEQKRLLASVRTQIVKLQAEERAQQAKLAAEARARLAAERAAEQRQRLAAAAAARAAAEARARAAAQPAAPTTTQASGQPDTQDPPTASNPATSDPGVPTTTAITTDTGAAPPPGLPAGHPEAAQIALQYLGVPYAWGGASPAGFDCSGLVMYVYAQLGISLPHYAAAQYGFGTPVPRDELQPGDLVFFDGLNHVGIYIGGGMMVHAPHTGDVVKISPLSEFGAGYVGARRL